MLIPSRAMPPLFVVLWSTGFISARYAMPYAEPFAFLATRFAISLGVLLVAALVSNRPRLPVRLAVNAMVAGALLHGLNLGFVFWAIHQGFPSGLTSAIVSLQPLLVAAFAGLLLGEVVTGRQWCGIALGFAGTVLVLLPKLNFADAGAAPLAIGACVIGLISVSAGVLWQKRFVAGADLVWGTTWQYFGAVIVCLFAAVSFEDFNFDWNVDLVLALLWSVFVLSIGSIFLLNTMIGQGKVSKVSSLFYLVPAVTAVMAFVLFGEALNGIQLVGMGVTALGVALATN
ncbi:MAG TPA: DMT family transporter, partial [Tianweitania sediminis]|nr:DMT family transporter [Tianweitania sediminis]